MNNMPKDKLHIPTEIANHSSDMKTLISRFAYELNVGIDFVEQVSLGNDDPLCEEDPVDIFKNSALVALEIWSFCNQILNGDNSNADLMKRFIEDKKTLMESTEE